MSCAFVELPNKFYSRVVAADSQQHAIELAAQHFRSKYRKESNKVIDIAVFERVPRDPIDLSEI